MSETYIWPQPPGAPLTDLAKRYMHPFATEKPSGRVKGFDAINYQIPWKSGLTPLTPPLPGDEPALDEFLRLENFQTKYLNGFRAAELQEMGALAHFETNLLDSTLDNIPIHPILEKHKWEQPYPGQLAKYPLGLGREGFWETQNPVVWNAILPAIKLASQILWNVHTWPWWAGFLDPKQYSEIGSFDIDIGDQGKPLHRFKAPSPWAAGDPQRQQFVWDKLLALGQKIDFKFFSNLTNPSDGMGEPNGSYGISESQLPFRPRYSSTLWVSFEMVNPLLDPNIGIGDKLLSYHLIAATILHELTHALCCEMKGEHPGYDQEPYFEQEVDAEVGHSFEKAVFGGGTEHLTVNYPSKALALAGAIRYNWPTSRGLRNEKCPTLVNKGPLFSKRYKYPIPLKYFEDLSTQAFWQTYVRKYGYTSTHMGPRTKGIVDEESIDSLSDSDTDMGSESDMTDPFLNFPDGPAVGHSLAFTAEESRARQTEAGRQAYVNNFRHALRRLDAEYNARRDGIQIPGPRRGPDTYIKPEFRPVISEDRYLVIRLHLFTNLRALALTTHWFSMPEHLMLKYILDTKFKITATEWRAFLLMCEDKNELYNTTTRGYPPTQVHKYITRNENGWPRVTLNLDLKRPRPADPARILRIFDIVSPLLYHGEWILNSDPEASEHLFDFDIVNYRKLFNIELSKTQLPRKDRQPFTMDDLLWVINWWELNRPGERVTFGPFRTGIIRLYGEGWPAKQPTPPLPPQPVVSPLKNLGISSPGPNFLGGLLSSFPPNMAAGRYPPNANLGGGLLPPNSPKMEGVVPSPSPGQIPGPFSSYQNQNPTGGVLSPSPLNMGAGQFPSNTNVAGGFVLPVPPNQGGGVSSPNSNSPPGYLPTLPYMGGGRPPMAQTSPSNQTLPGGFSSLNSFLQQNQPRVGGISLTNQVVPPNPNSPPGFLPDFPSNMAGGRLPTTQTSPAYQNPAGGLLPTNQFPPPNQSPPGGYPPMNQFLPTNGNPMSSFAPARTGLFTNLPLPNIGTVLNTPGGLPPGFNQNAAQGVPAQNTNMTSPPTNQSTGFTPVNQSPRTPPPNQNPFSNTPPGPSGFSP